MRTPTNRHRTPTTPITPTHRARRRADATRPAHCRRRWVLALAAAALLLTGVVLHPTSGRPPHVPALAVTSPGQVVVDGQPEQVLVSTSRPVHAQLRELYPRADVRVSRSGGEDRYLVHYPARVRVTADGTTVHTTTTGATVASALRAAVVRVGPLDLVELTGGPRHVGPGPLAELAAVPVTDADSLDVIRVARHTRTQTTPVPARTRIRTVRTLPPARRRVRDAGRDGSRTVRITTLTRNGRTVSTVRTVISHVPPRPRIIEVGAPDHSDTAAAPTTPPAPVAPAAGDIGSLNWAALAACESSGNPRATNPAGYYGLYQFDLRTWASVGGTGNPAAASPAEQTLRAQRLYAARGASPWPVCGRRL